MSYLYAVDRGPWAWAACVRAAAAVRATLLLSILVGLGVHSPEIPKVPGRIMGCGIIITYNPPPAPAAGKMKNQKPPTTAHPPPQLSDALDVPFWSLAGDVGDVAAAIYLAAS